MTAYFSNVSCHRVRSGNKSEDFIEESVCEPWSVARVACLAFTLSSQAQVLMIDNDGISA